MVYAIPGASACITAITSSGQVCRRFAFEAFLPKDKKEHARVLLELQQETRTIILYEAPHRLKETLKELEAVLGDRELTITRELTKKFEEKYKTTLSAAVTEYETRQPKGEYVLVIAGKSKQMLLEENIRKWENVTLQEHLQLYLRDGMDKKEAMKAVAKDRNMSKRDVYQALLQE